MQKQSNKSIKHFNKTSKFPLHWISKISIRFKRNAVIAELHGTKQFESNIKKEIQRIREKYRDA